MDDLVQVEMAAFSFSNRSFTPTTMPAARREPVFAEIEVNKDLHFLLNLLPSVIEIAILSVRVIIVTIV